MEFSVVTYNVCHIYSSSLASYLVPFPESASIDERAAHQATEIMRIGADIVALQECFHNIARSKLVAELASMYAVINQGSPNIHTGPLRFGSGLLILYRKDNFQEVQGSSEFTTYPYRISTHVEKCLGYKGILTALLKHRSGKLIDVANTHLASVDFIGRIREGQMQFLNGLMSRRKERINPDVSLVLGDFNNHKSSFSSRAASNCLPLQKEEAPHYHRFTPVPNSPDGATWDRDNPFVDITRYPLHSDQLDHIFVKEGTSKAIIKKVGRVFTRRYFISTLLAAHKKRVFIREKYRSLLNSTSPRVLNRLKNVRLWCGGPSWVWGKDAAAIDPGGALRKAIDQVFGLTDISDFEFSTYRIPKARPAKGFPLSDHYGLRATIILN